MFEHGNRKSEQSRNWRACSSLVSVLSASWCYGLEWEYSTRSDRVAYSMIVLFLFRVIHSRLAVRTCWCDFNESKARSALGISLLCERSRAGAYRVPSRSRITVVGSICGRLYKPTGTLLGTCRRVERTVYTHTFNLKTRNTRAIESSHELWKQNIWVLGTHFRSHGSGFFFFLIYAGTRFSAAFDLHCSQKSRCGD